MVYEDDSTMVGNIFDRVWKAAQDRRQTRFLALVLSLLLILLVSPLCPAQIIADLDEINGDIRIRGKGRYSSTSTILPLDFNGNGTTDIMVNDGPNVFGFMDVHWDEVNRFIDMADEPYDFQILTGQLTSAFGRHMVTGDFNHDGIDDLAISDMFTGGSVYILFGSATWQSGMTVDIQTTPADITIVKENTGLMLGCSLACLDVNHDGIDDLAMGEFWGHDFEGYQTGVVYVLYGSEDFDPPITIDLNVDPIDLTLSGHTPGDIFGYSVSSGDINHDGIHDLIVGAVMADDSVDWFGRVYVFFGSTDFPPNHIISLRYQQADITIKGTHLYGRLGMVVGGGDVNGDGIDDIISSTYAHENNFFRNGAAYVIYGIQDFPQETLIDLATTPADITFYGDAIDWAAFGLAIDVDDVDNDGIDDMLFVGRTCLDTPDSKPGVYYLFLGRDDFPPNHVIPLDQYEPTIKILGDDHDDQNHVSFCRFLDINADGVKDICLGASDADCPTVERCGEIYIFFSKSPIDTPARLVAGTGFHQDNHPEVRLWDFHRNDEPVSTFTPFITTGYGTTVAAGDCDGDGYDEILAGPGPGENNLPMVTISTETGERLARFFAYGIRKYGVNVAAGDIDGDGIDEILTGPGPGNVFGPHVRAWKWDGQNAVVPIPQVSFLAYGTPRWGVNVTAGDIDGDGIDEIITGPGPGQVYGPHVRAWNWDGTGQTTSDPRVSYLAYGTNRYGVNVAAGDIDGDGIDEILTGPGPGEMFGSHIRGWNYDGDHVSAMDDVNFLAYNDLPAGYGALVACGDVDFDRIDEILTAPGPEPDNPPYLKTWNYDGDEIDLMADRSFLVFEVDEYKAGARIAFGNCYLDPPYIP